MQLYKITAYDTVLRCRDIIATGLTSEQARKLSHDLQHDLLQDGLNTIRIEKE